MSETPVHGVGPGPTPPGDDPWAAFGYLVAGVLFYGVIGWVLSRWLHAPYLIPLGILVGAGFGLYMVFHRYRFHDSEPDPTNLPDTDFPATNFSNTTTIPDINIADIEGTHNVGRNTRPASDDQGETS